MGRVQLPALGEHALGNLGGAAGSASIETGVGESCRAPGAVGS